MRLPLLAGVLVFSLGLGLWTVASVTDLGDVASVELGPGRVGTRGARRAPWVGPTKTAGIVLTALPIAALGLALLRRKVGGGGETRTRTLGPLPLARGALVGTFRVVGRVAGDDPLVETYDVLRTDDGALFFLHTLRFDRAATPEAAGRFLAWARDPERLAPGVTPELGALADGRLYAAEPQGTARPAT